MEALEEYNPRTVEQVFRDFKGRRAAIVRALIIDVNHFFLMCDPEKQNLCLYGFPNEKWEVKLPAEEIPPELPEPALGINFARDGMDKQEWLALVAVYSDAWLLSVAFYFGARFGFDRNARRRLFNLINSIPTVCEIVTGTAKQGKENSEIIHPSFKLKSKLAKQAKASQAKAEGGIGLEDEEDDDTFCGICGDMYKKDEHWMCCDICKTWYHGFCVRISPVRFQFMKFYKCPSCKNANRSCT